MNKNQLEVQKSFLNSEKNVLEKLKESYQDALDDIDDKIAMLMGRDDAELQNVIYQIKYQEQLKKQTQAILEKLQEKNYDTVSEYLNNCYTEGFLGTMYDLNGQGIPLILPIDPKQMLKAVELESKLSEGLYDAFDMKKLQKQIQAEISRGISTGKSYSQIAKSMEEYIGISRSNALRIARTEGHRIQCAATKDAQYRAKEKGADVLKQWDAALDGSTRENHRKLDGQIRELDEDFEVDGQKASAPGMFGDPAEDCNCRCALLQRARWSLDESELATLEERAEYFGLDKTDDFNDFIEKYMKAI